MNSHFNGLRLGRYVGAMLAAALAIVLVCGTLMSADETVGAVEVESRAAATVPSDEVLGKWIEDLGSPSYAVRKQAQTELMRAGAAVHEQVAAAAYSQNAEVRARCMDILRRHAAGDDAPLAAKAQTSLDELADSADLSVARAAQTALATNARRKIDEAYAAGDAGVFFERGGFARPAVIRGRGVIRAAPLRIATFRAVSIVDGKRTIVAEEGGQRVEISDGGDDGIKMTIARKVDGKEKKESFAAKDAKEFKEKHPEAFKEFEKYAKDAGGAVVVRGVARMRGEKAEGEKDAESRLVDPPAVEAPAVVPPPKLPPLNHVDVPDVSAAAPRR